MKALILAAGKGKRLADCTKNINKCMILHEGKPIIEYSIAKLSLIADISEIIIVVGYRAEDIINYFGTLYNGKRISYVIQWELKGLVHAIECAKQNLHKESFMLLLGDEFMIEPKYNEFIEYFYTHKCLALLGSLTVQDKERIKRTYTFLFDKRNNVNRLIEKPKVPLNNLMGTGHVIFRYAAFEYFDQTPIHPQRGEKELPDLLQTMIDYGKRIKFFLVCSDYNNLNTSSDQNDLKQMHMNIYKN